MLALSAMHDHNFHGGPILLGTSPPHPLTHASHGLMNQDNFKHPPRLESQVPGQQQLPYLNQSHGRYSHLPPPLHPEHLVQYDVDPHHAHPQQHHHHQKDDRQSMSYLSSWQYNDTQQIQQQKPPIVNEQGSHVAQARNVHSSNDLNENTPFIKPHGSFSKPAMSYPHSHPVNDIDFEDVDEDDISDLEEEEELRRSYELYRQQQQLHRPDVTSRLLVFADVISSELKKYFGRTKEQDDSCDVYEDKWATTKSGRELYYADLLRIAQGDMEPASKTVQKSSPASTASTSSYTSSSPSSSPKVDNDNRCNFKGVRDVSIGMGPLTQLFEYGLKTILTDKREESSSPDAKSKRMSCDNTSKHSKSQPVEDDQTVSPLIPMHERNLPDSFWKEPGAIVTTPSSDLHRLEMVQHGGILATSRLPDFSDLVESWQGNVEGMETAHQSSDRLNHAMEQGRF